MTESVYTEAVVAEMVKVYNEVINRDYDARTAVVKQLATNLGQTVASVRSKLVAEKVYKAKEASASSAKGITKEEYVKALEAMAGTSLTSFTKASKKDLKALMDFIVAASATKDADEGR